MDRSYGEYNVEPTTDFPDYADDELVGKTDEEIRQMVLEDMGLAPANDVPEDMGRANFQPVIGKEVDNEALRIYMEDLAARKNAAEQNNTTEIQAGRERIAGVLKTKNEPEANEDQPAASRAA